MYRRAVQRCAVIQSVRCQVSHVIIGTACRCANTWTTGFSTFFPQYLRSRLWKPRPKRNWHMMCVVFRTSAPRVVKSRSARTSRHCYERLVHMHGSNAESTADRRSGLCTRSVPAHYCQKNLKVLYKSDNDRSCVCTVKSK